ncbi:MAG: tRNA uridine-5-carboxymethylaminomethyl(34) synthesis GTPase MnmE [Mariprofundaceae bacterium]
MKNQTTIAAIATPAGRGGVGMIRLSGPHAKDIAMKLSCRDADFQPRKAHLCHWVDSQSKCIDSGLVLFFPGPNSYTGEDVIEFQGHGSPVLLQSLLKQVFKLGAVAAEPGEFTRRAVEHGKMNLSQAEAVVACIDAATERAARQAQRHLHGDFGRQIESLMDILTGVIAHLEACLDFPEEEVPSLFFGQLHNQVNQELVTPLQGLLKTAAFGERLFDGSTVAIIGAPNVGKSSLLNLLAGYDRAIVSEIPGTTRDVLEVDFEVHGIPVRLVDTAGMRETDDVIEQEGVRRASQAAGHADVVVFVADRSRPETWINDHSADVLLMNKSELPGDEIPEGFISMSVKTGDGIESLICQLANLLGEPAVGEEGLLVTRERHRQALQQTLDQIYQGLNMLGREDELDLAALQWRRAWSSLGEILGVGDVELILDRVFSEFCIGK